jgi:hypothetical protein
MTSPEMLAAKLEKGSCSSGDARERKATKLEKAPVPIYLWEVAMDVARKCALRGRKELPAR